MLQKYRLDRSAIMKPHKYHGKAYRDTNTNLADLDFTKPCLMATHSDSTQHSSSYGQLNQGGRQARYVIVILGPCSCSFISSAGGEEDGTKRVVLPK